MEGWSTSGRVKGVLRSRNIRKPSHSLAEASLCIDILLSYSNMVFSLFHLKEISGLSYRKLGIRKFQNPMHKAKIFLENFFKS